MTKTLTFLDMIAAKIMNKYKKHKKCQKMTKTLTLLDMIAAKIMKKYKNIQKMTKNDRHIDMFEYDSSENNEK